eukprot:scaffold563_cov410-Prasinococcus_capsulatus_cf.AAC.5
MGSGTELLYVRSTAVQASRDGTAPRRYRGRVARRSSAAGAPPAALPIGRVCTQGPCRRPPSGPAGARRRAGYTVPGT